MPCADGINYHGKRPFSGTVGADGKVTCGLCSADAASKGLPYNRRMNNTHHYISSHISSMHKHDSAYLRGQQRSQGHIWSCTCGRYQPGAENNWHSLERHIRGAHRFRGPSDAIKSQGFAEYDPDTDSVINPSPTAAQQQQQQDSDKRLRRKWEELPAVYDEFGPEYYKDDDEDGPSGAAGGLIQANA
ncbi:hypothetical protein PG994_003413 [Apiospora phragmitis]|uniref:Uncharacterized protein n=1 Tax=Apiospora phragmitis TaxID=2905665 RepID=A0ABR1VY13_9PEZI